MGEIRFGKDSFLSNFYACEVEYEGLYYKNAEACFHAQKCEDKKDQEIFCDLDAGKAWQRGRNKKLTKIRSDWEDDSVK